MIRSILRRRPIAVDEAQSQAIFDPELKLPKTISLVIIITSNLLLQVSQGTEPLYYDPKLSADIILCHRFLFKRVYRAPWGNISVIRSHHRDSYGFRGFGFATIGIKAKPAKTVGIPS